MSADPRGKPDEKRLKLARNPYAVLGLAPSASDSEIRAAFRKLAKQYHPDRNPDDKKAEEKFKEISAAFDIVGDSDRRKKFDRGEIDEEGRERGSPFGQWSGRRGQGPGPGGGPEAGASFEDLSDIFSDLFGSRRGGPQMRPQRGRDVRYRLDVEFLDAATGAKRRVTMPDDARWILLFRQGLMTGRPYALRGKASAGQPAPAMSMLK